jgi:hypothetical protein
MNGRVDGAGAASWNMGAEVTDTSSATVQLGESTLHQVAHRLNMAPDDLLLANPQIQDPNKLLVGQEIRLPKDQVSRLAVKSTSDEGSAGPGATKLSDPGRFPSGDPMNKTMAELRMQGGAQATTALAGPPKGQNRAQWLGDLARDPGEAHQAWKNLGATDRSTVLNAMENRYGKDFKDQFLAEVKKGKPQVEGSYYGPGLGPTADQLKARGYKLGWIARGNAAVEVETWVHPSGKSVQRDISTWQPGGGTVKPPGTNAPPKTGDNTKIEIGIDTTPLDEQQKKAVQTLHDLDNINNELNKLLNQKPIPWDDVRRNVMHANDKQRDLDALMQSDDPPNMDDLDPDFHDKIEEARDELTRVYDKFAELDPSFMSHPVVDP